MGDAQDDWWAEQPESPAWHHAPQPLPEPAPLHERQPRKNRRRGLTLFAVAVAVTATSLYWAFNADTQHGEERAQNSAAPAKTDVAREETAAREKIAITDLTIDGVETDVEAEWSRDGRSVLLSVEIDPNDDPKAARITSGVQTDEGDTQWGLSDEMPPKTAYLDVEVPLKHRRQKVQLKISVGALHKEPTEHRTIEFLPDRKAVDADTRKPLKQHYSRLSDSTSW